MSANNKSKANSSSFTRHRSNANCRSSTPSIRSQSSLDRQMENELNDLDMEQYDNGALQDFLRCCSFARCLKHNFCQDVTPGSKLLNLEIPCPKCNDDDCFWSCRRCFAPLKHDPAGYLCCDCGVAPIQFYEFRCKNVRKHGERYAKYEPDQLELHLKKLISFKDKNILILGQTGVGKSTWINSIAHYLAYDSLEIALDGKPMHLVPSSFTMVDEKYEEKRIIVGEETSVESFKVGESATQEPKVHSLDYKGGKLVFIDTPGIGDVRGLEQDKKNFARILDYISTFDEIHGICVLLKPNEARLTTELCYCINQLFSHLHRSAAQNIVFCLTNTQGTLYRPGETFAALKKFLGDLKTNRGIEIELNKDTIYCMDNCAFRYLCARRQGILFDDRVHAINVEAWEKSWSETYRLINHIANVKPHIVKETITLNESRRIILSLAKPLALITKEIQINVSAMEDQLKNVEALTGDEKDFRAKLKIRRYYVEATQLKYPRTVCVSKDCIEYKKNREGINQTVYNKHCHEHCYLEGVTVETYPNEALLKCFAMAGTDHCQHCGCSWKNHMHITWEHTEESDEIDDQSVVRELRTVKDKMRAKEETIRKCEERIAAYNQEQKTINEIAARFAAFLKENAIVFYNDAIEEYLKVEISNAEAEASLIKDNTKVEGLRRAMSEYLEEKNIILAHLAQKDSDASVLNVDLKDIQAHLSKLYRLPLTGANIKAMLDLELNGQRAQLEQQKGHFNTYDYRSEASKKYNRQSRNYRGNGHNYENDTISEQSFESSMDFEPENVANPTNKHRSFMGSVIDGVVNVFKPNRSAKNYK